LDHNSVVSAGDTVLEVSSVWTRTTPPSRFVKVAVKFLVDD